MYAPEVERITHDIDGVAEWHRIIGDQAWDGIAMGWMEGNKAKWLRHTKGRKVVVQAGGCCGMYPRLFAQHFDHVYTFEPCPRNFYALSMNTQVPNITKVNGVLGPKCAQVGMNGIGNSSNPGLGQVRDEPARTLMVTIDCLNLRECDLIQLDVEGYELQVLHGAAETIGKFKPTISCERGNQEILNFLGPYGYVEIDKTFEDVIYVVPDK